MAESPSLQWEFADDHDINDGKPWSENDVQDLALALKDGGTIEGAADFLGRWGTRQEVLKKAVELGLLPESANERS
jgi:hypothetical protein